MTRKIKIALVLTLTTAATQAAPRKFDFTKPVPEYSDALGYGFEPAYAPDAAKPFYFSIKVPEEGNYKVTVTLGDPGHESTTTVKAELRRLMLEQIHAGPGEYETRSFLVNVRTPRISDGVEVRLKPREKTSEAWAWDNRLTLGFTGDRPALRSLEIEKADDAIPTLYIAGDSTSTDQGSEPFNSWGQMITRFFKAEIAVANNGESGESLNSFVSANRLRKVMSTIKSGDFLMIQMGHNDQKEKGEGVGAFTTYKSNLKRFIGEARQHGATPILITPVNRLTWDADGKITNSLGDFPEAVRQTAQEEKVALLDLNAMSKPFYEAMGPANAPQAFAGKDTTHHSDYGSYELAKCMVEAIRQNQPQLAKYLLDGLPRFDPARPDPFAGFAIPADPIIASQRPYGN